MHAYRRAYRPSQAKIASAFGAVCVAVGAALPSVNAQTVADESQSQLQEVIVTATKRNSRAEDLPISMSVFSSTEIEQQRILAMSDFTQLVPGVVFIPNSVSEAYVSIRGAETLDDSTGTDQNVALFIDDVSATSVADFQPDLFDIDHIEVLKGPQGTFFGRNAANGVISIYTRQPTFATDALAELTYGENNLVEVKGMFNTPIIADTLAARFTATSHNRDSYIHDVTTGGELGNENRYTVSGKLLFTPVQTFKGLLAFDYLREKSSTATWVYGNFQPMLDPGLVYSPSSTAQGTPGSADRTRWGSSLRMDWTTGIGTVTSIAGYRHVDTLAVSSITADPLSIATSYITERDNQFSEELRLASPGDQRLTWVTGLYYLHSDRNRPTPVTFDVIPGTALSFAVDELQFVAHINQDTTTISSAAFGDATYAITDQLKLSVGGRYTHEEKSGSSFISPGTVISGPPISAMYSKAWSAFTPRVALTYQPLKQAMLYATASEGFQSGGFNVQGSTAAALNTPFNPEYVWNYELGSKFDGWDHRMQGNIAAFIDKIRDLQIAEYNGQTLSFQTTNAGAAEVKGAEADFSLAAAKSLTFGANYAYLHGRFTDYVINNGSGVPPSVYTGNTVPYTPTQSVTVSADLHFNVPQLQGRVSFAANYTYRSSYELDVANDIPQFIRDRTSWNGLWNASAAWTRQDDRWEVRLWGKNVSNIRYTTFGADLTPYYANLTEFLNPNNHIFLMEPNPPRSFGVTLTMKM